jgi:hypothetical protein
MKLIVPLWPGLLCPKILFRPLAIFNIKINAYPITICVDVARRLNRE